MGTLSYLQDKDFLKSLDNDSNKFFWVRIEVLDSNEIPIKNIEGRVQPGSSISLNGNSSVRRTCSISIIAEDSENDLTDINNLLSANKKIKIFEGIKNNISTKYDSIIWFPLGVFVIVQPNISHSANGCIINLTCKDKMCLLNGECAGGLPTSITFHEYDQVIGQMDCGSVDPRTNLDLQPNNYTIYKYNGEYYSWTAEYGWKEESDASSVGETTSIPQRFYDIIQTLVCNYGGESLSKIFISDVPLEIKQIVRYVGSGTLYYNVDTGMYTTDDSYVVDEGTWKTFSYNEDVGYVYTDFTYPGSLVSSIGDNVCTILDKIKNTLGNYEYFYDIEGNFIFQEIKNYLNTSYDPTDKYRLDNGRKIEIATNGLSIIDGTNYEVNFYSNNKSIYTFTEGSGLIVSYSNTPNYTNLKNDFHVWGENDDGYAIHYHLAIKTKPSVMNKYKVVYLKENGEYTGGLRLAEDGETTGVVNYIPSDWRAELYLQGLTNKEKQIRPDVYQQELLDLFDAIYNFYEYTYSFINGYYYNKNFYSDKAHTILINPDENHFYTDITETKKKNYIWKDGIYSQVTEEYMRGKFKTDIVNKPNELSYFFDYLEPINTLYDCSVDILGTKIYSYQQEKINRLYNTDIPNNIMIDLAMDSNSRKKIVNRCEVEGQPYSNVNSVVYSKVAIGTSGYTAQETARELLYQYTGYNESISIQSVPIYYLDVNSRITVQDRKSGIFGDYIINSISLPLDAGGTMTITASRALERI